MSHTPLFTNNTPIAIAALLLQRGCPEDKLDKAYNVIRERKLPMSLAQAVEDADYAIREVS